MSAVLGMHATAESMVLGRILSIQQQLQNSSLLIQQVASTTVPHLTLRPFDHSKDSVIPIVEFVLGTITYVVSSFASILIPLLTVRSSPEFATHIQILSLSVVLYNERIMVNNKMKITNFCNKLLERKSEWDSHFRHRIQ